MEINLLFFKNPVLKKNYEEEVPIEFILFCYLSLCVVLAPTVFFLPMIVKRKLLAHCQMCIHLDGSRSILKNELVGGGTFFEFLILNSFVR